MAADRHPRTRPRLRYVEQTTDEKTTYIVKDPVTLRYYRFGKVETWIMQQLDGSRSTKALALDVRNEVGVETTAGALEGFVRRLRELDLLEPTQAERNALVMERMREGRKSRSKNRGNTVFRMRFSFGDPDRLLERMVAAMPFFWTRGFFVLSLAAFATYFLILLTHWGGMVEGFSSLYRAETYTPGFILTLYLTAVVILVIHEFGHGLTCKRLGGEVHEMGAMLLYFSPAFFCNVNDAWTFNRKADRLWVTFAGGWIQLFIGAIGAVLWLVVTPGTWIHGVAWVMVLVGGGISLFINYNPLIPLDGYYALIDWIEVPNLRERSFRYLGAVLKRRIMRMDVPLPDVTPRERRLFLTYGILASLYLGALLGVLGIWLVGILLGKLGVWALPLIAYVLWKVAGSALKGARRVVRVWTTEALAGVRRRRLIFGSAGLLVLLAVASSFVPWTIREKGVALVEPLERLWLRPSEAALVERIFLQEGQLAARGDTVLVLRSAELELAWRRAAASVEALERALAGTRAREESGQAQLLALELAGQRKQLEALERRRRELVLRAPFDARVVTPHLEELLGARVAPGDSLVELWSVGPLRARIRLSGRDAGEVNPGDRLGIRFSVRPEWTWRTNVAQVAPAVRDAGVEILAPLGDAGGESPLRADMVGVAKIQVLRTSVAGAVGRWIRRHIRTDWFL